MQAGGAAFDALDDRHLDMGPVDEPVLDHLRDRVRLGQVLEHGAVATSDHGVERVDHLEERLAPLDHALVMEGDVDVGFFLAHPDQALLELLEAAEHVAVVGPEAGEIDVGEEEDPLGDPQTALAAPQKRALKNGFPKPAITYPMSFNTLKSNIPIVSIEF